MKHLILLYCIPVEQNSISLQVYVGLVPRLTVTAFSCFILFYFVARMQAYLIDRIIQYCVNASLSSKITCRIYGACIRLLAFIIYKVVQRRRR